MKGNDLALSMMFITHIHAVKCAFELQSRWSHSQSWWCASFQHSFKCNYVITSFKSHSHVGDCLFPFQGPLYCPQVVNFSRSVKKFWCHSCQGFCKLNRYSSCLTIFLFWNQLSYFKDHVYSKSSLLKWNQRCPFFEKTFWKSSFFFFQRSNTRYSKYTVLWLSCILKTEIDML